MSSVLFLITISLWMLVALFDYGEFCYVWQLKEYRLDRFKDFISSSQGKRFLKSYLVSGRIVVAFVLLLVIKYLTFSLLFLLAVMEFIRILYRLRKKQYKFPKKTTKAGVIVVSSLLLEVAVWFLIPSAKALLLVYGLRFLLLSVVVLAFGIPTKLLKDYYILMASRKMLMNPKLKVIGVTGSYGKTTVKNFLARTLSAEYKVLATPKNINTEIGVAKFILAADFSDIDIFVVEMGAYRKGEIKIICDMVKPTIGILTAINEQHLSLFGSIKNIQETKFELLFSLPANGLAITNMDNPYCRELLPNLNCKVKTFGMQEEYHPDCLLKDIETSQDGGIIFKCEFDEEMVVESQVIGMYNAMNMAPCIIAAKELGLETRTILEQMKGLDLPEGTMRVHRYGESLILDDSYNSNPDGFIAALEVLKNYPERKKIVITRGMLELGDKSQELHQKIGRKIAAIADRMIIISPDSEADLKVGAGEKIETETIYNADELLDEVKKFKDIKSVILLENRLPSAVLKELIVEK